MEKYNIYIKSNNLLGKYKYLVTIGLFFILSCKDVSFKKEEASSIFDSLKDSSSILTFSKNIENKSILACDPNDFNILADEYIKAGKYNEAINILLSQKDSLLSVQKENDKNSVLATIYDNLGKLYNCVNERDISITYYNKAIEISENSGNNKSLLYQLNNLATTYLTINKYNEAISLLNKADSVLVKSPEILDDSYLLYFIYSNLSSAYVGIGDYSSAKPFFLKAKKIINENDFTSYEKAGFLTCEADFLIYEKKYQEAFDVYKKALDLSKDANNFQYQEWILGAMEDLSKIINNYKEAYYYQKQKNTVTLEKVSKENEKERAEIETKYGLLEKQREIERQQAEINLQEEESKRIKAIAGALLFLVLGAGTSVYVINKQKKIAQEQKNIAEEQKNIAEEQKKIVEQKNQELEEKNEIITQQKADLEQSNEEIKAINDELLEKNEIITQQKVDLEQKNEKITTINNELKEKNYQITSSINYASGVQKRFLYNNIQKHFPESFVFYKPKDIVSGDFYFSADVANSNKKMLAVVDCTGHGVPGAFLTMLGKEKVKQFLDIAKKPSDIINSLDCFFLDNITPDDREKISMHDAMDISCVFYDKEKLLLEYAITSGYIIVIRNGSELHKLSLPFRASVGAEVRHPDFTEYKTKIFQLIPGDQVFLFSDGVYDQFIVKTGKKLLPKRFEQLVQEVALLPMNEKLQYITDYYDKIMQGDQTNQTDDMSLVGFTVS